MPTPKAILYARFSPRPNPKDSESIETQLDYCRRYCHGKGYEVVGEFTDAARSGADAGRPGLAAALGATRSGYRLVVYRWSRLARDVYLAEGIVRALRGRNARVEAVDGHGNEDTAEANLVRQIITTVDTYQRRVNATLTRQAMLRQQAAGKRISIVPPYGHHFDPKDSTRILPDRYEQTVIARICALRKEGLSLRKIARALDKEGLKPRTDKPWHHWLVARILKRADAY